MLKKDTSTLTLKVGIIATTVILAACNKINQPPTTHNHPTASVTASAGLSMTNEHMNHMNASNTGTNHINAYMAIMDTMHTNMATGIKAKNADVSFVKGMIPHHQGAIEMANVQLQYGKDTQMKALAQKIIDAQQSEIKFMQDWLAANESKQPAAANAEQITKAYEAKNATNHDAMMQGMMEADPDIAFVKSMIPHHQGAIDMTVVEKQYGKNPEILKLAQQINTAQTPEIQQMQDWLAKRLAN